MRKRKRKKIEGERRRQREQERRDRIWRIVNKERKRWKGINEDIGMEEWN